MKRDTICAISTPLGEGGIGIIRISGDDALEVGRGIFRSCRKGFKGFRPYTLHHGWIVSKEGHILDEVLVSYMPAPGSYTGEDVFEINCHGGPLLTQTILKEVLSRGVRLADPGEFTLRAFLNGKMDLSQAEAVAEIISSPSPMAISSATQKLSGHLTSLIHRLKNSLEEVMAHLAAYMDFEEDDIDLEPEEISLRIGSAISLIEELMENYERLRIFQEGARIVLCGEVNAGKSSLLNALIGRRRAIVTPVPGTTRDYIEEFINLQGIPVRIIDTAGFRETHDEIEIVGMEMGRELIEKGDLICLVYDHSCPFNENYLHYILSLKTPREVLIIANKIDLPPYGRDPKDLFEKKGLKVVGVSAKKRINIDGLIGEMRKRLLGEEKEPRDGEIIPNLRQYTHLSMAHRELMDALEGIKSSMEIDLIFSHLEKARDHLREITGEISTEDILDKIFSSFCIGK